jgi:hypothetical protein
MRQRGRCRCGRSTLPPTRCGASGRSRQPLRQFGGPHRHYDLLNILMRCRSVKPHWPTGCRPDSVFISRGSPMLLKPRSRNLALAENWSPRLITIKNSYQKRPQPGVLLAQLLGFLGFAHNATATQAMVVPSFRCLSAIQTLRGSVLRPARYTTDRAPWMNNVRRYASPRLLMPNRRALPPLKCCRGTSRNQAANCRPLSKIFPSLIAATAAAAVNSPMPSTAAIR